MLSNWITASCRTRGRRSTAWTPPASCRQPLSPAGCPACAADLRALLSSLFASTGTIMLTAGDEFGRSQGGNNNGHAQDNALSWIDWEDRDPALEGHVAGLASAR